MKRIIIAVILALAMNGRGLSAQSTLQTLISGMSPGSWAQLTQTNINSNTSHLNLGAAGRTSFAYSAAYDPINKKLTYIGAGHGEGNFFENQSPGCHFVIWDEDTNLWDGHKPGGAVLDGAGPDDLYQSASYLHDGDCNHGYDNISVDPVTGQLFFTAAGPHMSRLPYGTSTWIREDWNLTQSTNQSRGSGFWSGAFSGSAGDGVYVVYQSGAFQDGINDVFGRNGQIVVYDPTTDTWIVDGNDLTGFGVMNSPPDSIYQSFLEYNPIANIAVFGGGSGTNVKRIWRLDSDHTITRLEDFPGPGLGTQLGNLFANPVNGKFLVMYARVLWELDPTGTGTWTQLDSSQDIPPAAYGYVGAPNPPNLENMFGTTIPGYEVALFVGCISDDCAVWVYKPLGAPVQIAGTGGGTRSGGLLFLTLLLSVVLPVLVRRRLALLTNKLGDKVHVRRDRNGL